MNAERARFDAATQERHNARMQALWTRHNEVFLGAYYDALLKGLAWRGAVALAELAAVVAVWWWIFNGMGQS